MDNNSTNDAPKYYLHVGHGELSPSNVFFECQDERRARELCSLFAAEYGTKIAVFQYKTLTRDDVAREVLLCETLDDLALYDDPDPGIYDPSPSRQTLDRAQYACRAQVWHEILQWRLGSQPSEGAGNDVESGDQDPDGVPNIDEIPSMSAADNRNSGLILLLMLAQAYYTMLEATVSMASWVTMLDLELNHSYLWTVQNLTNLLKNHEELQARISQVTSRALARDLRQILGKQGFGQSTCQGDRGNPMGDAKNDDLRVGFDSHLKLVNSVERNWRVVFLRSSTSPKQAIFVPDIFS